MWLVFMWGGTKIFLYLQRTMEIGDQRGRGAASFLGTTVATAGRAAARFQGVVGEGVGARKFGSGTHV